MPLYRNKVIKLYYTVLQCRADVRARQDKKRKAPQKQAQAASTHYCCVPDPRQPSGRRAAGTWCSKRSTSQKSFPVGLGANVALALAMRKSEGCVLPRRPANLNLSKNAWCTPAFPIDSSLVDIYGTPSYPHYTTSYTFVWCGAPLSNRRSAATACRARRCSRRVSRVRGASFVHQVFLIRHSLLASNFNVVLSCVSMYS